MAEKARGNRAPERPVRSAAIYFNPSDHPGKYVVRGWSGHADGRCEPDRSALIFERLEHARMAIPDGWTNMGRDPGDDPVIVETWLEPMGCGHA